MSKQNELYCVADLAFPSRPEGWSSHEAADMLQKAPVLLADTAFNHQYIDRPPPGTVILVWNPHWPACPSDGLRYLSVGAEAQSREVVQLPDGPVELECLTMINGFLPPASLSVSNGPQSAVEDQPFLNRYRKRFRISRNGIQQLSLLWWGTAPNSVQTPPGWKDQIIRSYPLPDVPEHQSMYPFKQIRQNMMKVMQQQQQQQQQAMYQAQQAQQAAQQISQNDAQRNQQIAQQQAALAAARQSAMQQQAAAAAAAAATARPSQVAGSLATQVKRPTVPSTQTSAAQPPPEGPVKANEHITPMKIDYDFVQGDPLDRIDRATLAYERYKKGHRFLDELFDSRKIADMQEEADTDSADKRKSQLRAKLAELQQGNRVLQRVRQTTKQGR